MNGVVLSDCTGREAEDETFGADSLSGFSNNVEIGVLVTEGKRSPSSHSIGKNDRFISDEIL